MVHPIIDLSRTTRIRDGIILFQSFNPKRIQPLVSYDWTSSKIRLVAFSLGLLFLLLFFSNNKSDIQNSMKSAKREVDNK